MSVDNLRRNETWRLTAVRPYVCCHLLSDVYLVATAVETYKVVNLARRGRA